MKLRLFYHLAYRSLFIGIVLFSTLILSISSGSAFATTYDLAADYTANTVNNNPNGPWAYLYGGNPLPYQPYVAALSGGSGYAPSGANGNFLPLVWQNAGQTDSINAHSWDNSNGGTTLNQLSITWTAPFSGVADISGFIYYNHLAVERSNNFTLTLGATQLTSAMIAYNTYLVANQLTFNFTSLSVTAGEVLTLSLIQSAGQTWGSMDTMDLTINEVGQSSVPEPATTLLLGIGLAGLAAARRKKAG